MTDFVGTDQLYGWSTANGQFYQTWADFKAQIESEITDDITLEQVRAALNVLEGNIDFNNNDIVDLKELGFQDGGAVSWNSNFKTIDIDTGLGPVLQVGQELYTLVYNNTGDTLLNGTVVYSTGQVSGIASVGKALSDTYEKLRTPNYMTTMDIPDGTLGFVTFFGYVRGVDTSAVTAGDLVYVSDTVPGAFTATPPDFPSYQIQVGRVVATGVTDGALFVNVVGRPAETIANFFSGTFRETFAFRITSDGTTITGSIEPEGANEDMTMIFSDGLGLLQTTPPATITLPAGTDTSPQVSYVYVPSSTRVLTTSTSWPAEEHIKVAVCTLQSAATTQTNGALKNQNWNDHLQGVDGQGHMSHITQAIRDKLDATWKSGVEPSVTINTGPNPDDVFVVTTGGTVMQLHDQTFPAQDMSAGDDIHIVNDPIAPYTTTTNLNTLTTDATGGSLSNADFSVVVWGAANKSGEPSHLFLNLPGGVYGSPTDAIEDANGFSNYTIPSIFQGVGFLIARFTFSLGGGLATWTLSDTEDLRGFVPNSTAGGGGSGGGGGGATTLLGLTDTPSAYTGLGDKPLKVNAGATGVEFADIPGYTLDADTDVSANAWVLDEDNMVSNDATKVPTQQSVKAYVDANAGGQPGTTVVENTTYSQDSSVGVSSSFSREDHSHGTTGQALVDVIRKMMNGDTVAISFLGDSVVEGTVGVGLAAPLQARLRDYYGYSNITVTNDGHGGQQIDQLVATYLPTIVASSPDLIIFMGGINDTSGYAGGGLDPIATSRDALYQLVEDTIGIPLLLLTPTPTFGWDTLEWTIGPGERLRDLTDVIKDVGVETATRVVDMFKYVMDEYRYQNINSITASTDLTHYTASYENNIADFLFADALMGIDPKVSANYVQAIDPILQASASPYNVTENASYTDGYAKVLNSTGTQSTDVWLFVDSKSVQTNLLYKEGPDGSTTNTYEIDGGGAVTLDTYHATDTTYGKSVSLGVLLYGLHKITLTAGISGSFDIEGIKISSNLGVSTAESLTLVDSGTSESIMLSAKNSFAGGFPGFTIRPETTDATPFLYVMPNGDGASATRSSLFFFITDYQNDSANYEALNIKANTADGYTIRSAILDDGGGTMTHNPVSLGIGNDDYLTVAIDGNIGVGGVSSPSEALEVDGTVKATAFDGLVTMPQVNSAVSFTATIGSINRGTASGITITLPEPTATGQRIVIFNDNAGNTTVSTVSTAVDVLVGAIRYNSGSTLTFGGYEHLHCDSYFDGTNYHWLAATS